MSCKGAITFGAPRLHCYTWLSNNVDLHAWDASLWPLLASVTSVTADSFLQASLSAILASPSSFPAVGVCSWGDLLSNVILRCDPGVHCVLF